MSRAFISKVDCLVPNTSFAFSSCHEIRCIASFGHAIGKLNLFYFLSYDFLLITADLDYLFHVSPHLRLDEFLAENVKETWFIVALIAICGHAVRKLNLIYF